MPVTTRFSANIDDTNHPSPPLTAQTIGAASVSSGGTTHSSPNGSISSYSRTNSVDSLDDSHSSSSGGCSGHCRQLSNDSSVNSGSDYLPTRSKKSNKTAHNPLQFVKTGTCTLYKKAEEQIKKAEEVKKLKTHTRQDEEEWQHNLDNWKSKRRQISHKTVERAEEWKKLEVEESEKSAKSKKNKTFSEMMEERSKRGRKLNYFSEDWDNDDFDKKQNGWSGNNSDSMTSPNKYTDDESDASSIEKSRFESPVEPSPQLQSPPVASNSSVAVNGKRIASNGKTESSSVSENGATPTEEYTFDKAIQNYVQYAENHQRKMAESTNNGVVKTRTDFSSFEARYRDTDVDNGTLSPVSDVPDPEPEIERSGGTAMTIVVTLVKSGLDQRDFGFTTRGQGRGLVFVDSVNLFGPADNADLRCDDEILAVNGESVSNRSHSAIVFAIKQAVYTGCLELRVYRYDDKELALNLTQSPQSCNNSTKKKPSRVEERKAVFSGEQFPESPTTPDKKPFVREQSPRVDIRKRRSLFEASQERTVDQSHQQTHRAADSRAFKNKIASFDKPTPADLPKQSVVLDSEGSFKEKLKSFEKMEHEERKNERTSVDRRQQFKTRLASFERLDSPEKPNPEPKQSVKDKLIVFEKQESFERSQSCDLLALGCEESRDSPKKAKNNELDWIDVADERENGGRPRIIDVVAKETTPEPVAPEEKSDEQVPQPQEVVEEVMVKKMVAPAQYSSDVSWENRFLALERKILSTDALCTNTLNHNLVEEELGFNLDCRVDSSTHIKSGFELAESLEETPIVASNPSSPFQNKRLAVSLDASVNVESVESVEGENEMRNQLDDVQMSLVDGGLQAQIESMAQELNNFEFDDIIDAPIRLVEPPKEKPPPPPSQQEKTPELSPDVKGTVNLRRAESSKRIRKEMIQRRSDFLGIDPSENQEYLDFELNKPAPPNMEAILRAEKLFEEQLRQHPSSETLENNWRKCELDEPVKTNRLDSKASEDDITRKEREIIENLEREEERKRNEIIAYFGDDQQDRLEEERLMSELDSLQEEKLRRELHERERRLQQHEPASRIADKQELLRLEKEKVKRQQDALAKEKDEYQRQVQQYQQKFSPAVRRKNVTQQQTSANHHDNAIATTNNLPASRNLKGDAKPVKSISSNKTCLSNPEARDENKTNQISNVLSKNSVQQHQPMTKQTLHALSALPKAKITDGDRWIARRKPEAARRDPSAYNQHWLIQEAEMRRISEQQNRRAKSPNRYQQRPPPPPVQTQFYDQVDSGHFNVLQKDNGDLNGSITKNYSGHSPVNGGDSQMLSVSGKKKCSHCAKELGRGAAMIIESLQLFYHIHCFKCCVCHVQLGNGLSGADVRVRNQKLHCHNCYSNDEAGLKFSKV